MKAHTCFFQIINMKSVNALHTTADEQQIVFSAVPTRDVHRIFYSTACAAKLL